MTGFLVSLGPVPIPFEEPGLAVMVVRKAVVGRGQGALVDLVDPFDLATGLCLIVSREVRPV